MTPKIIHTGPFSVNSIIIPIFENKVFIVDPASCSFSEDENVILDYLDENKLNPVAIILTHGHFDHISGLPILKKRFPNIPILIHKNDAKMIGSQSEIEQSAALIRMGFIQFIPFVSNLPVQNAFLEDGKNLFECISLANNFDDAIFDEKTKESLSNWKIIHTPGHTKGCICLLNEIEQVLISGDTLFYHSWGRTDLPDGNEKEIQNSLKILMNKIGSDVKIYPGHDYFGFTKKD